MRRQFMILTSIVIIIQNTAEGRDCENCCEFPRNVKNAKMYPQRNSKNDGGYFPDGERLKFVCRTGFKLVGTSVIRCEDSLWKPSPPTCTGGRQEKSLRKVSVEACPEPPSIEHGEVVLLPVNTLQEGSVGKYKCNAGYELLEESVSTIRCTKNDTDYVWVGKVPKCVEKPKCNDPGVFPNGFRTGRCCLEGSVILYQCFEDWILVGKDSMKCLQGGVWSNHQPICTPQVYCPEPPLITHGKIVHKTRRLSNFYTPDDEIYVVCNEGYSVGDDSETLYCEDDGKWDEKFPQCKAITCEKPQSPINGFIREFQETNQTAFPNKFEVNFGCDAGFRLIGNSLSKCGEFGWSDHTTKCEEIQCADPGIPENGNRRGNDFRVGGVVEFECYIGYNLLGSAQRTCLENGKWSGELARCDNGENDCLNPGAPIGGKKTGVWYGAGNTVTFDCNPGKILVGSKSRTCQRNGEWSGQEAKCIDKNEFDNKDGVSFHLQFLIETEKIEEEKRKELLMEDHCELNDTSEDCHNLVRALPINSPERMVLYFAFDVSGSVGALNFQKSINFVKAMVQAIGVSELGTRVGVIKFSNIVEKVFSPLIHASTEDVIEALNNIEYTEGGTATTLALKTLQDEMIPLTEENLDGKEKSIIFILTDGRANMEGDPKLTAEELKKNGVEIYCIGITGDIKMKTLYDIASSKDEHVFILDSYDTMDWLVQQIINGTIDYSKCGIQGTVVTADKPKPKDRKENEDEEDEGMERVIGGDLVKRPWPWMAAFHLKDNAVNGRKTKHYCGSSLLNRFWVMTAAHCLYNRDTGEELPKETIIINLGLTDIRNRTHLQDYQVQTILIHPQYDYKKSRFNYDIALLKLSRPAEFNPFVRPICLPPPDDKLPKDSSLYREGESTVAIGWGYEKRLKPNERKATPSVPHLKRVSLPITKRTTCLQSLKDRQFRFTNVMFCAGNGKGNSDTCLGDSGGPIMQKLTNDIQQEYWTQVGIVSWGVGCGQVGQYGYYTNVAKFVDWIQEKTK